MKKSALFGAAIALCLIPLAHSRAASAAGIIVADNDGFFGSPSESPNGPFFYPDTYGVPPRPQRHEVQAPHRRLRTALPDRLPEHRTNVVRSPGSNAEVKAATAEVAR